MVNEVLKFLTDRYGELQTVTGHNFDYLGMNLDFGTQGVLKLDMRQFVGKLVDENGI